MTTCPACGDHLEEPRPSECPSCGARLEGATEAFAPIGAEDEQAVEARAAETFAGPVLMVRKGPEVGERLFIDRPRLTVGRDPECDIFLNDITVSRSHAVLEMVGSEVSIRDVGSLNGTYVNGVRVDKASLADGDIVQVGKFQMVFMNRGGS
ncbi:MAG: FHA domain-containing protein [Coriobacteriia bacterium]|nr:FHA domain-containing protein [Coriobacteriia bacterium]